MKKANLFLPNDPSYRHGDGKQPGKYHGQRQYKLHGESEAIVLIAWIRHLFNVSSWQRHSVSLGRFCTGDRRNGNMCTHVQLT